VLGAHLDHLGVKNGRLYPGAEDNASGVAVVLSIARALAREHSELGRSIIVVLFGAEEIGMYGSKAFVDQPPVELRQVAVMVNIDMIGRPLVDQEPLSSLASALNVNPARAVGVIGARKRPALRALVDRSCFAEGIDTVAPEDLPDVVDAEVSKQTLRRGDSWPFARAGVPTLFFGSGESRDYHQPEDTIDRLNPGLLERRARALLRTVLALSRAPRGTFEKVTESEPAERKPSGWYAPIGIGSGLALHSSGPPGAFLSAEFSLVHLHNHGYFWVGAFVDTVYDLAARRKRIGFGPELGFGPAGLDASVVFEQGAEGFQRGVALRPMVTISLVTLSARWLRFARSDRTEHIGELGLLVKWPVGLGADGAP
jgi:hypothetical protein